MFSHPVAVAADVDEVAMVQHPVDQGGCHHLIPKDVAPLFEALVGRQYPLPIRSTPLSAA